MISDIIIANVLASAALVLLIYFLDINEKEPPWTLIRVYVITILITFLFGKLKTYLFTKYAWEFSPFIENFIVAGFFEEFLKLFIILVFVWHLKSFNEETDGIIYYLVVAAGFAVLENVGYSFQFVLNPYVFGMQTGQMGYYRDALQRIVLLRAVSGHIFINVVSGFFLGLARRRKQWWILIPGFLLSVFLHGMWNQLAMMGLFVLAVLSYFIIDAVLLVWSVRMSMYNKFMRRLRFRMKELIQEAGKLKLDENIVVLMQGILRGLGALRRMEGSVLTTQAKEIVQLLPPVLEDVPRYGPGGLNERLLRVNGVLGKDRQQFGGFFWFGLFAGFAMTGFFVLLILMELM